MGGGHRGTSDQIHKNRICCCHDNPVTRSAQCPHESIEPNVCVSKLNWPLNGRVALTRLAWTCAFGPVAACDICFRVPNLVFTRQADRTRRSHTGPCQPLADTHILVFISTLYLIIESSFDAPRLASLFVS